jgi:hypothetical protein
MLCSRSELRPVSLVPVQDTRTRSRRPAKVTPALRTSGSVGSNRRDHGRARASRSDGGRQYNESPTIPHLFFTGRVGEAGSARPAGSTRSPCRGQGCDRAARAARRASSPSARTRIVGRLWHLRREACAITGHNWQQLPLNWTQPAKIVVRTIISKNLG